VTGPVWPALRLAVAGEDQVMRLAAFRAAHPEVIIEAGGFGTCQARIPEPNGETVITRHRLGELLDRLGEVTGQTDGQPGSDPG
jgi:hypothetical protein